MTVKRNLLKVIWYLILLTVSLLFCFPAVYMILTGFKTPQETVVFPPTLIPKVWTLNAYREGLSSGLFGGYLRNSIFVSGMIVAGTVVSSALVGFGFARLRSRFRNLLFVVVLATMMIPSSVTLIPVYSMYASIGWIDTYLPLIVPAFAGGGAFSIFLTKQFFEGIPNEIVESAKIDGAGWMTIFLRMFLPNSKPVLLVVTIFAFVNSWNDFFTPLIFLIDPKKFTVAIGLNTFRNSYGAAMDIAPLMAMATLSVLPILVLFLVAQKYFVQGITTTGIK
ncbi:MAG: carbohydrate ABC transporter permease [Eubacteriales bacterium]|nr:carbohydrate ABC transporter permease [Eubacteriales bacterium]